MASGTRFVATPFGIYPCLLCFRGPTRVYRDGGGIGGGDARLPHNVETDIVWAWDSMTEWHPTPRRKQILYALGCVLDGRADQQVQCLSIYRRQPYCAMFPRHIVVIFDTETVRAVCRVVTQARLVPIEIS